MKKLVLAAIAAIFISVNVCAQEFEDAKFTDLGEYLAWVRNGVHLCSFSKGYAQSMGWDGVTPFFIDADKKLVYVEDDPVVSCSENDGSFFPESWDEPEMASCSEEYFSGTWGAMNGGFSWTAGGHSVLSVTQRWAIANGWNGETPFYVTKDKKIAKKKAKK